MQEHASPKSRFPLLPGLPLFLVQPILKRIVTKVATHRPELFSRLDEHCHKSFVIDPINLPFLLLLRPNPERPQLTAISRRQAVPCDVRVSATFGTLLKMIDGRTDSDALFFSRDLTIKGDTEAVVALRNALDDMDNTLVDEVIVTFGPLARPMRAFVDLLEGERSAAS